MKLTTIFKTLGPVDAKNIWRDPLLAWLVGIPVVAALAMRLLALRLTPWLLAQFDFDLTPYYPLLMSFFMLLTPLMAGTIIGFLLLDERDDRTLRALQVTPLSLNGYLLYRLTVPMAVSVVIGLVTYPLVGLVPLSVGEMALVAALAAWEAPLYALFLAAFAENKVTGFAVMKGMSSVMALPMAAYFVPQPWQWLAGLLPTFWPARLFWAIQSGEPGGWAIFLTGLAWHGLWLVGLTRRFNGVMTR